MSKYLASVLILFFFNSVYSAPLHQATGNGLLTVKQNLSPGKLYLQNGFSVPETQINKQMLYCEASISGTFRAGDTGTIRSISFMDKKDLTEPRASWSRTDISAADGGISFYCHTKEGTSGAIEIDYIKKTIGSAFEINFELFNETLPDMLQLSKLDSLKFKLNEDIKIDPKKSAPIFKDGKLFHPETPWEHKIPMVFVDNAYYGDFDYLPKGTIAHVTSFYYISMRQPGNDPHYTHTIIETNANTVYKKFSLIFKHGNLYSEASLDDLKYHLGNVLQIIK